ncbi:MAG TPA: hypothetical protein VFB22_01660 [Candidatus Baltobacteraceae bacterium]|nr:hypothetical protein [Candidatus Baltobacteraceae bacterium]
MTKRFASVLLLAAALLLAAPSALVAQSAPPSPAPTTFGDMGREAAAALRERWYAGKGAWHRCLPAGHCGTASRDWGAYSLTEALFLYWLTTGDASVTPVFQEIADVNPGYGPCRGGCREWSDVPLWDARAALDAYIVTRDRGALAKAVEDYTSVTSSDLYARGRCPEIDYQRPNGETGLKTLETDANRILVGVLLFRNTHDRRYLADARAHYDAVRAHFFDRAAHLYTVYVFDDGKTCRSVPHRFFASVNAAMVDAGRMLADATMDDRYGRDAQQTETAIEQNLNDARGVFADLQAENDIVSPLISMMWVRAIADAHARAWIVRNAEAAIGARTSDGSYGRFFDGPPPGGEVTMWETNGGLALAIAAAALEPATPVVAGAWRAPRTASVHLGVGSTYRFVGSGVAFTGTLGARPGHAQILIDGRPTVDQTGIWQGLNYVPPFDTVLFAWRWPRAGVHVIRFVTTETNAKEGPPFVDVRRANVLLP